ncbi:MAG TPA: GatB/YqeY domain-containing protein [bacterium]|nr:GatB/YqeY domain-containing protein [bacterium]HQG44882.1 GatB/YqeY domain-containing protein [bacterium]HQI49954.1 GatB/YqeY domain-containing protein [bacterium]HQJ63638.1 GatB/YqeY domain-containing protein [bacterium]
MSLLDRLTEDMKSAMKSGETVRLGTIRLLRGQIKDAAIDKRADLTDDEELGVLANAAKKRREAIQAYQDAGRLDLAAKEEAELAVIQSYLPAALSVAEVEAIVDRALAEAGAQTIRDLGKVMPLVMNQTKGRADGKMVSEMVRRKLSL